MTLKSNKTLDTEVDDSWRRKGHSHIIDYHYEPRVCPACNGYGQIKDHDVELMSYPCEVCGGSGEI